MPWVLDFGFWVTCCMPAKRRCGRALSEDCLLWSGSWTLAAAPAFSPPWPPTWWGPPLQTCPAFIEHQPQLLPINTVLPCLISCCGSSECVPLLFVVEAQLVHDQNDFGVQAAKTDLYFSECCDGQLIMGRWVPMGRRWAWTLAEARASWPSATCAPCWPATLRSPRRRPPAALRCTTSSSLQRATRCGRWPNKESTSPFVWSAAYIS